MRPPFHRLEPKPTSKAATLGAGFVNTCQAYLRVSLGNLHRREGEEKLWAGGRAAAAGGVTVKH